MRHAVTPWRFTAFLTLVALTAASLMLAVLTAEGREYTKLMTPQGQMLTVIGEAKDRSAHLDEGKAMGFLAKAPVKAFVEIENLRAGNLVIATSIDQSGQTLDWPAGQWIECVLSDGTVQRPRRIFTCGPMNEVRVIELGRESRRISFGQLFSARSQGTGNIASPIYVVIPNKRMSSPDGRTHWMEFRDITTFRFVRVPVDSLTTVAERR
ncbi:MAG: hypothetical protein HY975_03685 [Candidatus Kerfeldbacteria bacterium]|nr:hypothetical protein [Candidatus Kerfeldbacteria bacterium]